jgi:hypothetical protein
MMMAVVSLADVTERLFAEFDAQLPLRVIAQTVRECRRDLAGAPESALPELVERSARHRLRERTGQFPADR